MRPKEKNQDSNSKLQIPRISPTNYEWTNYELRKPYEFANPDTSCTGQVANLGVILEERVVGAEDFLPLRRLFAEDFEFGSAVLLASVFGVVGGDGFVESVADEGHAGFVNAFGNEIVHDGFGAVFG